MSIRLARAATGAALLLGLAAVTVPSLVARDATEAVTAQQDEWLTKLTGTHRMLFDASAPNGGIPLVHMMNFYNSYNTAYQVPDSEINAVLTFYGMTTFHGLSDAMWAKYKLGEFVGEKDAQGVAMTVNPWRTAPVALGMTLPQASLESLQKRGATYILCNTALTVLSGMVAQSQGLDPQAVYADMKANMLPGVTLVPAMVIAIDKAQQAGLSYHRQ